MRRAAPLLLLGMLSSGCVHRMALAAAPGAQGVEGDPYAATGSLDGVHIEVRGRWQGDPPSLGDFVSPVRVSIENHSGVPVRLRYQDFQLTTQAGVSAHALPPFRIQRPGGAWAVAPTWPFTRFWLARPYGPFYPGWSLWPGAFAWDSTYYDAYGDRWEPSLPSRDMLQKAMPEGVLEDGGSAIGYLYFQRVQGEPGTTVKLQISLVDANTEKDLGKLVVPMVVQRS